jgi:single-stranded-DNA-specific exonuclease
MADYFDHIKAGNPIDVCYSIVENYYRGASTTQLRVKDLRERDELV